MINKPYDVFGTWYNDYYLLSGNLHWTGHLNSCSAIWLNKAYQETGSEEESVVMRLFKFSNINASSIRTIMVANCLEEETRQTPTEEKSEDLSSKENQSLIDEQLTNQEDDEMQEMEPNKPLDPKEYEMEASKPKTSKSLQGIQVFENGEFITKYLEVDPDVPNDKLNCTIEYSNDYRQAQSPKKRLLQRPCGYHSDTNDNLPASEISEQSNNGHSSTDSFDQRQLLSEIETASRPDTAVPFNVNAVVGESHAEALFAPDTGQQSLEASTSSVATSSLKRTLHGQQQQQGEICRDPRTCDSQSSQHSCDDRTENSAAVSVPTATVRPRPNIFDIEIPERHYKTRKSGNGKCKKIKDKYLIFTKGSETYTPHQIGIKRIKPFQALGKDGSRLLPNVTETTYNNEQAGDTYDEVDHLIDMHGHIIGMTLSPDHRYLYVNSRPWPKNYFIENPLYPPPIASEIDIHVIDLLNMREVGTMHRAHKAYTGAEDKHGYLWDRHYGLCLHKYLHTDVVNSVAFNPADPEVLVTVSDDFSIKIWSDSATSSPSVCVSVPPEPVASPPSLGPEKHDIILAFRDLTQIPKQ
ncbi:FBXW5-like protein, partial [Mya arenaria]